AKPAHPRRFPVLAATLAVGFVLGLGVLFGWLRTRGNADDHGVRRVAVLPFENLGRPDDEYFADGVADAVRGKLAALPNLQVAARASSAQYKRTTKSPQEIGRELGVQYLLTGTVRWEKSAGGPGRVQVSPELVQVSTASTRWQEPFDAALTDVFQVQSEVATRVAQSLGVALGSGDRARLEARPTGNLDAYDLYLRGKAFYDRGYDRDNFRASRELLERAVALDSTFALAWAALGQVRAAAYWFYYERTDAALADARAAAQRSLQLRPGLPEGHLALGYYWYWGRLDYEQALRELQAGLVAQPSNADIVFAIAAVRRRQGRWPEAIAGFSRAVELDPRSNIDRFNLGETRLLMHDYAGALADLKEAIALAPQWGLAYHLESMAVLGAGQGAGAARTVLHEAAGRIGFSGLARAVTENFNIARPTFLLTGDPAWAREIDALTLSAFGDTVAYYRIKAEYHRLAGQRERASAYDDSARVVLEARVRERPEEPSFHGLLGTVYAAMGRAADANREGDTAVALLPLGREAYLGGSLLAMKAQIEAQTGRPDAAIARLETLLRIPSSVSRAMLEADPAWALVRGDPRFRRLAERSGGSGAP
ncbi:MAG TPA: hypothetical protein VFJ50_09510, partial [Gemmatimonadales bacterium]|nr:hypothetical protein [Gemmatimonadales bacterium]